MAGFFGMGNFAKEGKGVKKDIQQKRRFFLFFELYFRKFGKLIQLNLIYVLFCIPIITIGPATVAMMKITRCYSESKPVFLLSDFWDSFKENFVQGLIMGIISFVSTVLLIVSVRFYYLQSENSMFYIIPLGAIAFVGLIFIFASFYTYLLISSVNLKIISVIKNAIILAIVGLKTNICTLFFTGIIHALSFLYFPLTTPVILIFTFATTAFITAFNSFQHIYTFIVKPYYQQTGLPDPYIDEENVEKETVFEDATM